jgi:hypothetical protein
MQFTSMFFRSTLLLLAAGLCFLTGCGPAGIPRVPVKGKITYAGGDWPKPPIFTFTASDPAPGMPSLPESAAVQPNGEFKVNLVPGTYVVNIECYEIEPAPDDPTRAKSYVPKRMEAMDTKPKFEVPVGAKEVEFTFDIPKA